MWGSGGYLLGHLLIGFDQGELFWLWLLLLALGIAASVLISWRVGLLWILALFLSALGFERASHTVSQWGELPETLTGEHTVMVIKREPVKAFFQPLTLAPIREGAIPAHILWRAPKTVELMPGQVLHFNCDLKRPENFDPHFDYRTYLATKKIGYVCDEATQYAVLSEESQWRRGLFQFQTTLKERMHKFLPDPAAGLLEGLFLGGDDSLSKSVVENFRRAGLSHIVAVSGYNMTLVAFAVLFLALLSGLWRKTATLLAVFGIVGFLLLIDTSAASIRAAFMAWIVFFAFFVGRPGNAWNGLFLAGLIMASLNPLLVRFDVGFQLSFLATLALITASPYFERLLRRKGLGWKSLTLLLSTLVIELFIFPILAFHFGTLSLMAPFANLVALPLIPLTMALGFLMLFLGTIIPFLGTLLSFPVWLLLTFLIQVGEWFGRPSWSTVANLEPTLSFMVLWYLVLAGAVWYSRKSLYRYALRMDH